LFLPRFYVAFATDPTDHVYT